jgi:acyl-CoA thioester hydrolase
MNATPPAGQPHQLLADYPVVLTIPVQWGEMDAYGHVNNTVLFRYFESARVAYLGRCRFLETYDDEGVGAILHSTDCRFRRPLRYPDTIQVGGRAVSVERDRFTMAYQVVSLGGDDVVAEGSGIIVAFDYRSRGKTDLPERVREGIAGLERG